jgi:hypothetical protein
MTTYRTVLQPNGTFRVETTDSGITSQIDRVFATEADAGAWIAAHKATMAVAERWKRAAPDYWERR